MTGKKYFENWWNFGYRDIIPVVPPDAKLKETSYLKKNNSAGKAPGIRYKDGFWGGMPGWREHQTTEDDVRQWDAMGASVGLRRGAAFMLDIDAYDQATADQIERDALEQLGPAPRRVGSWPKRALLYRADGLIPGAKLIFDGPNGKPNQIETPAQVVLSGTHSSGKPYKWDGDVPTFDKLTPVSADALNAFLNNQKAKLPAAKRSETNANSDRANIDQKRLQGKPELVERAIRLLPNTRELFPTYDDMIQVGNAISGALPGDRALANELWHEWCSKWEGGDYDHDLTEQRWRTLKPPHAFGAGFLYDLAERFIPTGEPSLLASQHFDIVNDSADELFDTNGKTNGQKTDVYKLLTLDEITNRPPPKWLIERHIPEKSMGFVYSEPGAGKTFITLDMSLAISYGNSDWNGDAIHADPNGLVIYIAGEGSFGFRNRVAAWHKSKRNGLSTDSKRFLLLEHSVNFMAESDVSKLLRTLESVRSHGRPVLVVVDTVSRALPGADENLQKDMTIFVRACDAIKETHGCAVIGVHHAGKSGDMRGSTVLLGAGDFVFRLTRRKGATIGGLLCEKQKDGPDGWTDNYRFDAVSLNDGQSSVVVERVEGGIGPSSELTPTLASDVLGAIDAAWKAGAPWSMAPQTKDRYAVRRMVSDHGFDAAAAEGLVKVWLASGLLVNATRDSKRRINGLQLVGDVGGLDASEGLGGIFE